MPITRCRSKNKKYIEIMQINIIVSVVCRQRIILHSRVYVMIVVVCRVNSLTV